MKISEVIEKLKLLPQDAELTVEADYTTYSVIDSIVVTYCTKRKVPGSTSGDNESFAELPEVTMQARR